LTKTHDNSSGGGQRMNAKLVPWTGAIMRS